MIVNVRGTHGSGKSTLARRILELYPDKTPQYREGRKRPIGYLLRSPGSQLALLGHYETDCGGCDTISKVEAVYRTVRHAHNLGWHVLFEGILAQHGTTRLLELKDLPLWVVQFNQKPEASLDSVLARRQASGNTRELNTDTIFKEHRAVLSSEKRIRAAGIPVFVGDREQCFQHVRRLLCI